MPSEIRAVAELFAIFGLLGVTSLCIFQALRAGIERVVTLRRRAPALARGRRPPHAVPVPARSH